MEKIPVNLILPDGYHMTRPKANPDQWLAFALDANNKNPHVLKAEPLIMDTSQILNSDMIQKSAASVEKQIAKSAVGKNIAAGAAVFAAGALASYLVYKYAYPWVKEKIQKPDDNNQVNEQAENIKKAEAGVKKTTAVINPKTENHIEIRFDENSPEPGLNLELDDMFSNLQLGMDAEEARHHIMNIIECILELSKEVRIMKNAIIRNDCETDEIYLARCQRFDHYITDNIAQNLNRILSNKSLNLENNVSYDIYNLLGGGVRMNGTYIPVDDQKVVLAICNA